MSDKKNDQKQPLHEWLPATILKFLVFLAFAFVIYEVTVGLGEQDLPTGRAWVVVAASAGLLLLLAVDRLTGLKVSPTGVEATMTEVKAEAIEEVGAMVEDPKAAETAREQILQAQSAEQVQAAVKQAVKLNVTRTVDTIQGAIRRKKKCYVRYRPVPDEPVQSYYVAPLDIKKGKSKATEGYDYLWAYSYEHESLVSLRLDRVAGAEPSEESFDPAELTAGWKKRPKWNVVREW
jgi:predicted DNA-binding transcriptional regulator YafY